MSHQHLPDCYVVPTELVQRRCSESRPSLLSQPTVVHVLPHPNRPTRIQRRCRIPRRSPTRPCRSPRDPLPTHGVPAAAPAVLSVFSLLATTAAAQGRYRAVFSFGDSLVDAGNLVTEGIPDYLATARPPYGQTYFGYPTGRCSDGRLVVDFIAQELGLPLPPPSKAKNASFAQGANFAITGATALDTDFFRKRGLGSTVWNSGSLRTQIQWLRDLKPSLCSSAQGTRCKEFFAECLFVVGEFGGNDYNAPLFAGKDLREAYKLTPHVIRAISDGVEQLIAEGAKDLIVPGVMPSGCFPVYLTMYVDPKEGHGSRTSCLKRGRLRANRPQRLEVPRTSIHRFGRIGRLVLRIATSRDDIEVVAVNDPFIDAKYMVKTITYPLQSNYM
ncbi:GDSL esterase/lipase [Zea mays]|uniref:GDSL esterase/lipase n=1 Tax=Zea mays TaxID=4577 RepID=A0A1D6LZD2_MAIZE|nr:GDSL esterase/lipase [Zea mays]